MANIRCRTGKAGWRNRALQYKWTLLAILNCQIGQGTASSLLVSIWKIPVDEAQA
ncbi:hypothetical protein ANTHELSMS3_03865 [Antarctobacter heliothermus]|uniref:Uncharacterized protein n=1 Tax=Antarctobacter heliothermus TaxID=74033 RepID=A0A222E8F3_9RHOB|nr:hypothetical protein ANTHELSMS3_03865 [Antarctobacter heliothermus]